MVKHKQKRKRNRKKGLKVQTGTRTVTTKAIKAVKVAKPVNPHKHNQTLLPLNLKKLKEVCLAAEDDFIVGDWLNLPMPKIIDTPNGNLIHYDMGANVLGVAHLDSHGAQYGHFSRVGDRVYTASLDDRLGAYIVTLMLDQTRFPHDILLTTGEEMGLSTAQHFKSERQYNWVFEFDRGGTDTVMYEYENDDLETLIKDYGWKVGIGSYSDICDMEELKCKAFNFATGYQDYHGRYAYAPIKDIENSVKLFTAFYREQKDKFMEHTPVPRFAFTSRWANYGYGEYGDYYDNGAYANSTRWLMCEWCSREFDRWGSKAARDNQNIISIQKHGFCTDCGISYGDAATGTAFVEGQYADIEEDEEEVDDLAFGDDSCTSCKGTGNCGVCTGSGLCAFRKIGNNDEDNLDLLIIHSQEECEHCEAGTCKYCNGWGSCLACGGAGYVD